MLQLKHLVHDKELALEILSRWDFDDNEDEFLERFRISANAIYPFSQQGERRLLRFIHQEERSAEQILAELEFLKYLHTHGYPALKSVPSKSGQELEIVQTAKGTYYAVVFARVPGNQLDPETITDKMLFGWGQALGRLHRLSMDYVPKEHKRRDYKQQLHWMEEVLVGLGNQQEALQEVEIVSRWLDSLPQSRASFGLIHYDFETDNIFYDEASTSFYAIDFDDAVYHWFAMDIANSLASYEDEVGTDNLAVAIDQFLTGYRSGMPFDEHWVALLPKFRRYHQLYQYVRCQRCIKDPDLGAEPEWMTGLRRRFTDRGNQQRAAFGKEI